MKNRLAHRVVGLVAPVACIPLILGSCSSGEPALREDVARTESALSAGTNYSVTGTNYGYHETSAVSVQYTTAFGSTQQHWVVGFNGAPGSSCTLGGSCNTEMGWSYSSDLGGTSWTPNFQSSGSQFGTPASRNPSDGNTFAGIVGDPSLVPVYDPNITNHAQRVIYTGIANSSVNVGTDVIALLSNDGGITWGHPNWVNTVSTGLNIDNPVAASNSASPYSTYVAWLGGSGAGTTQISKIAYDSSFNFTASAPSTVPVGSSGSILHPAIAMGKLANCDGTHEAVYVAWATAAGRCPDATSSNIFANSWWYAVYDTVDATWYGPWQAESDSNWPNCVGSPLNVDGGDNDPRPRLAADPNGTNFWLAHTQSSTYGTRVSVDPLLLACVGGTIQPTSGGTPLRPKDPCYRFNPDGSPACYGADGGLTGGNGPDGGIVVNDEWGPAIAFLTNPTSGDAELVVTWYDTRGDQSNRNVAIQGASGINGANPFNTAFAVSSGSGVPWDHTLAAWWDYQALGIDLTSYKFLSSWGGDARSSAATSGIWSAVIQ